MINLKCYASGSKGNLYLASNGKTNIILECGINKQAILKALNDNKLGFKNINACFCSHIHNDHSLSIKLLQDYEISCYCTYETAIKYDLDTTENYSQLYDNKIYKINNDIQVLSFLVNHGNVECFGFVLVDRDSKILFITDFMECKKKLNFDFDKVFIECNYLIDKLKEKMLLQENTEELESNNKYYRQFNTHQSLDNCILHLKNINLSKCKEINLIHISEDVGNYTKMKDKVENEFNIPTYAILRNGEKI